MPWLRSPNRSVSGRERGNLSPKPTIDINVSEGQKINFCNTGTLSRVQFGRISLEHMTDMMNRLVREQLLLIASLAISKRFRPSKNITSSTTGENKDRNEGTRVSREGRE